MHIGCYRTYVLPWWGTTDHWVWEEQLSSHVLPPSMGRVWMISELYRRWLRVTWIWYWQWLDCRHGRVIRWGEDENATVNFYNLTRLGLESAFDQFGFVSVRVFPWSPSLELWHDTMKLSFTHLATLVRATERLIWFAFYKLQNSRLNEFKSCLRYCAKQTSTHFLEHSYAGIRRL